jgi:protein deglycase
MNAITPKKVLLLLCKGTETLEASAFIDVMGWANEEGLMPVSVVTAALSSAPVICTFGARIVPDRTLADITVSDFDALAIPGGFETFGFYEDAYSPIVQELIGHFAEAGKPVAAICVGALPLAKTGLLSGRNATTYHLGEGHRRRQLAEFGALVVDQHVVQDGQFITSSCPATAVEVALRLLAAITNEANAQRIRYLMGFSNAG